MIVCSTENPASDRDHIAIWDSAPDNALILRIQPITLRIGPGYIQPYRWQFQLDQLPAGVRQQFHKSPAPGGPKFV
jgi:hypothetical protein